ncbi:hypothetical protein B0J11DRAFT_502650 [Dendryphion nanum]|uniref:Uncharacterized protein n=1 Tax=Dendryphion nanum TaxID=256645 RepID=A0A9P9EEV3_9PLEO|nr:hypothetical protein B0J11DRAFT_502650 [Dendryphion nanum]
MPSAPTNAPQLHSASRSLSLSLALRNFHTLHAQCTPCTMQRVPSSIVDNRCQSLSIAVIRFLPSVCSPAVLPDYWLTGTCPPSGGGLAGEKHGQNGQNGQQHGLGLATGQCNTQTSDMNTLPNPLSLPELPRSDLKSIVSIVQESWMAPRGPHELLHELPPASGHPPISNTVPLSQSTWINTHTGDVA